MNNHFIGFLISAMLHAGLFSGAFILSKEQKKEPIIIQDKQVMLMVSMFQEKVTPLKIEPIKEVIKKPIKKIIERKVEAPMAPKVVEVPVEPVTKPEPKSEPKVKTKPVVALVVEPKVIEPKKEITPEPKIIKAKVVPEKKKAKKATIKKTLKKKKVKIVKKKPKVKHAKKPTRKPIKKARVVKKAKKRIVTKKAVTKKKVIKKVTRKVVARKKIAKKKPVRKVVKKAQRRPVHVRTAPVRKPKTQAIATHSQRPVIRKAAQKQTKKVAPQRHKVSPRPAATTAHAANLSKRYKTQLRKLIISKKRYPKRAKRRNQQGKVTLSFSIRHSGTIENIIIRKSSNNSTLDKAAIKAIKQSSRKLPFFAGMPKKTLQLSVTLSYVLTR